MVKLMSFKKVNQGKNESTKRLHDDIRNRNKNVSDRFLSILWRREVDFKLTTK